MSSEPRLLIVSNRLPVTATGGATRVELRASSGGLATGLQPYHEGSGGVWIGWPGEVSGFSAAQRADLEWRLRERGMAPVHLSRENVEGYYHGFANRVLWPLFHYQIDRVPVDATGWEAYREVNEAFADTVAFEHRSGDTIWIHDYQLMLLPRLVRQRIPSARIGFFLHIPFPSSEVFRVLPWRRDILRGLLGADLVGFHTFAYMRHFLSSLLHIDGLEADIDQVRIDGRNVRVGVFPMGIDANRFAALAGDPAVIEQTDAIRRDAGGRKIVLGVDRLDYTKGIPRRLEAVERLLHRHPSTRDTVRYIQVAVPSRGEVDSYRRFKRQVEESVGRINGACSTVQSTPVHYLHTSVSPSSLVALYRAADVMLVTPLRDGMNLVAKEFVASRDDDDGVLVLSEFAGASAELDGAVTVNPYDVDAVASAIHHSLEMPDGERRARMRTLRERVIRHDVHAWARSFLERLAAVRPFVTPSSTVQSEPPLAVRVVQAYSSMPLRLLLDYDGTLVPLARSPEMARPDPELLALLDDLAKTPRVRIDLVSGRPRETLEAWFGHLPVSMWAEHGFWHRQAIDQPWAAAATIPPDWSRQLQSILDQFTASTPGSHVERKSASIAWHYRGTQRDFGARQAHELRMLLGDALSNQPFEVLEGKKVIEIRLRGVSKAAVAHWVLQEDGADQRLVVAIGDDRTDDDLFRALPSSSVTIAVGGRPTAARFRVGDHRAVRQLLREIVAAGAAERAADSGDKEAPSLLP